MGRIKRDKSIMTFEQVEQYELANSIDHMSICLPVLQIAKAIRNFWTFLLPCHTAQALQITNRSPSMSCRGHHKDGIVQVSESR
jgi:hypothetical protein